MRQVSCRWVTLFNSFEIILENSFVSLDDNVINNTIDSIDSLFRPIYASSPQFTHSRPNRPPHATANRSPRHGSNPDLPDKSNWRSMVVNVNMHLHHKRAVFESCTAYVKPDVIFGTEAKLDPSTNVQEISPPPPPPPVIIKRMVSLTIEIGMEEGHS